MPLSSAINVKKSVLKQTFQQTQGDGIAAMLLQGQGLKVVIKLC